MEDFQQRVVDEKAELDAKIEKLSAFNGSGVFASLPVEEQSRMCDQIGAMRRYSAILAERISAFVKPARPQDESKPEPEAKAAAVEETPPVAAPEASEPTS